MRRDIVGNWERHDEVISKEGLHGEWGESLGTRGMARGMSGSMTWGVISFREN